MKARIDLRTLLILLKAAESLFIEYNSYTTELTREELKNAIVTTKQALGYLSIELSQPEEIRPDKK